MMSAHDVSPTHKVNQTRSEIAKPPDDCIFSKKAETQPSNYRTESQSLRVGSSDPN